jgi:hypothetical protein
MERAEKDKERDVPRFCCIGEMRKLTKKPQGQLKRQAAVVQTFLSVSLKSLQKQIIRCKHSN